MAEEVPPAVVPAAERAENVDSATVLTPHSDEPSAALDAVAVPPATEFRPVPRLIGTLSAGLPLRLRRDREFGQGRLGPRFVDLAGHYYWLSHGRLQHGPGLGLSVNLTEDGGFFSPVDGLSQWVVAPQYGALWVFADDLLGTAHLAMPIVFAPEKSLGVEFTCGAIYKVLAFVGVFAEIGASVFGGAGSRLNPMLTAEVGLAFDYEVLP